MTIQSYMADIGAPFWGSIPIMLLVGFAEWLTLLVYVHGSARDHFWDKRGRGLHGLTLAVILLLDLRHFPVSLHCLLLLILSTVYLCALTRCTWFNGVLEGSYFCLILELGKSVCQDSLLAYALAHLFTGLSGLALNVILLSLQLLFMALFGLAVRHRRHRMLNLEVTSLHTAGLLFPFLLYLAVRIAQYSYVDQLDNRSWALFDLLQYGIAVCALLNLITTESLMRVQAERSELAQRELLMQQKQQQYRQQQESIEYINRRYHDLKHYLNGFEHLLSDPHQGGTVETAQAQQLIHTIRREIDPYGNIHHTGSSVMDVLLAQRMQECQDKKICLLPYIDAGKLDFISTLDLCTLFGNAMDNAIEAVEGVPLIGDEQALPMKYTGRSAAREISVKIGTSDNLLLMRFQNGYLGLCRMDDGHFLTTKAEKAGHGYGLRSIADIAEKYGGSISTECTAETFTLHILIPLPA